MFTIIYVAEVSCKTDAQKIQSVMLETVIN